MMKYRYKIKPLAQRKIRSFYYTTISQWAGYHMANTDRWYFAYTIDGDTITVVDARHAQNMRSSESSI